MTIKTMREILFRGQHVDTKKWYYGFPVQQYGTTCIYLPEGSDSEYGMDYIYVIPETIGYFTGLYDSTKWEELTESEQMEWLKTHTSNEWKGKRIFEGDVVIGRRGYCGNPNIPMGDIKFIVSWYKGGFDRLSDSDFYEFKVLGNVHDNPNLF